MQETENFKFPKPDQDEFYDVDAFAQAMDMLDKKLYEAMNKIQTAETHASNTNNPHKTTKSQVGLGNVENKSSATIRGELTEDNVNKALGYTAVSPNDLQTATKNIGKMLSLADSKYKNIFYYEEHMSFPKEDDNHAIGYTKKLDDTIKELGGTWNDNTRCFVYYPSENGLVFQAERAFGDNIGKIKVTQYIPGNSYSLSTKVRIFVITD